MLAENNIGTVISDTSGRRDAVHMYLTKPVAFIRFVGNYMHATDFTRINDWVERIGDWMDQGLRQAYFFMHQHEELDSPRLAAYFSLKANKELGTDIQVPEFVEGAYNNFEL